MERLRHSEGFIYHEEKKSTKGVGGAHRRVLLSRRSRSTRRKGKTNATARALRDLLIFVVITPHSPERRTVLWVLGSLRAAKDARQGAKTAKWSKGQGECLRHSQGFINHEEKKSTKEVGSAHRLGSPLAEIAEHAEERQNKRNGASPS